MELGKAKVDLEHKMVPQGPGVTRHLSLPVQGQTPEWITSEMAHMDVEGGAHVDWKDGKISGAIYRAFCAV